LEWAFSQKYPNVVFSRGIIWECPAIDERAYGEHTFYKNAHDMSASIVAISIPAHEGGLHREDGLPGRTGRDGLRPPGSRKFWIKTINL